MRLREDRATTAKQGSLNFYCFGRPGEGDINTILL